MTQQVTIAAPAMPAGRRPPAPPGRLTARRPASPPARLTARQATRQAREARPPARPPAALRLPVLPASAAVGRRHVRRLLDGWQLAGCLDTALLLASELVTNAVTASRAMAQAGLPAVWAPIELSLRRTGTSLTIEVRDPNPEPPAVGPADPLDEDGRGLVIVDALSSRWGHYAAESGGKVVWCEIALPTGTG
jgi:Histidine kinase-like ATPase domain